MVHHKEGWYIGVQWQSIQVIGVHEIRGIRCQMLDPWPLLNSNAKTRMRRGQGRS